MSRPEFGSTTRPLTEGIVEVGRVNELIGGIFHKALRTCARAERFAGDEAENVRVGVDHIAGESALRVGRVGIVSLVGYVDEFGFGFHQKKDGVGERRVVGDDSAGLNLQGAAGSRR